MTDRLNSLTIVLAEDVREDDAETIIKAISMIKGVLSVTPHVVSYADHIAQHRVRHDLGQKLWSVLYPKSEI